VWSDTEYYKIYLEDDQLKIEVDGKEISKLENDKILKNVFSNAIDMGTWKYSWHIDVSKFRELTIRDRIKEIIIEKQEIREEELKYLKTVEKILMMQKTTNT